MQLRHTHRYVALAAAMFFTLGMPVQSYATSGAMAEAETMRSVQLDEKTWTEIQSALQYGYTNVVIPSAGIEQRGPHLPINAGRKIARSNADAIARRLGNTLVAPVIEFMPEGDIARREGNMHYAGTLSMPAKVSADIIEHTIRSLASHGFQQFFLIGESESAQAVQEQVARSLRKQGIAVYHVGDYVAAARQEEALRKYGYDSEMIGGHGGLRDTAEFMSVAPKEVRNYQLGVIPPLSEAQYGAWGDTSKATAQLGQALSQIKVGSAIAQICREAQNKPSECRR